MTSKPVEQLTSIEAGHQKALPFASPQRVCRSICIPCTCGVLGAALVDLQCLCKDTSAPFYPYVKHTGYRVLESV